MFNKEKNEISHSEAETVIGPSIKVKGNFHGEGSMIIEGSVEGDIKTKNFLSIGSSSIIIANITAENAKISGNINGNLTITNHTEITSTAKIRGDIKTNSISIENGAKINGIINTEKQSINEK